MLKYMTICYFNLLFNRFFFIYEAYTITLTNLRTVIKIIFYGLIIFHFTINMTSFSLYHIQLRI